LRFLPSTINAKLAVGKMIQAALLQGAGPPVSFARATLRY
jgi:hypothetical protein